LGIKSNIAVRWKREKGERKKNNDSKGKREKGPSALIERFLSSKTASRAEEEPEKKEKKAGVLQVAANEGPLPSLYVKGEEGEKKSHQNEGRREINKQGEGTDVIINF